MRVTPNYTRDFVSAVSKIEEKEQAALQQLSSGKRVTQPSDDPAAAAAYVQNRARAEYTDEYKQSVTSVRAFLKTADSALNSVVTALTRAISLGTQAATSTTSADNRQQIAKDVEGAFNAVLQAANTNYQGVYLFNGTAGAQVAFDAAGTYKGNSGANKVYVSDGRSVEVNVPGNKLFGNVFQALTNLKTALQSGTGTDIQNATSAVTAALTSFSTERVFYGSTLNQLDSAESFLNQEEINLASEENDLVGASVTQAATDLSQAVLAHNAALSAFAKVTSKTLLDYLG